MRQKGVILGKPDFNVLAKCCYYLKEKNCDDWGKEHNSAPYLGLMASEGGRRAKSLRMNGCNYFGFYHQIGAVCHIWQAGYIDPGFGNGRALEAWIKRTIPCQTLERREDNGAVCDAGQHHTGKSMEL